MSCEQQIQLPLIRGVSEVTHTSGGAPVEAIFWAFKIKISGQLFCFKISAKFVIT